LRQNLEIAGESNDERMQSVLSLVGLDSEFEARGLLDTALSEDAGNISGGQAQRIAIARGLLAGAEVLILDEPTSGLDRDNALGLLNLLRRLASSGITLILITHDSEIAELCDSTLDLTEFAA
jgi:ABC-type transport system involved in cytochrome bd biosynthesis fused ATPase/permease subunit